MLAYDLHVHSTFSGGESSLEELVDTAKSLGYRGMCFVSYPLKPEEESILRAEIQRVSKQKNFEIYLGFEATTRYQLEKLKKKRKTFDILLVHGGNININRAAVESPEVDILTHPSFNRNDPGINHILAKLAAKNQVALEINFREVLQTESSKRGIVIKNHSEIVRLAKKYHAPLIVSSGALSHWQLRDPLVLTSYLTILGLSIKEAKECISLLPRKIIQQAKERQNPKWIMPGVKEL